MIDMTSGLTIQIMQVIWNDSRASLVNYVGNLEWLEGFTEHIIFTLLIIWNDLGLDKQTILFMLLFWHNLRTLRTNYEYVGHLERLSGFVYQHCWSRMRNTMTSAWWRAWLDLTWQLNTQTGPDYWNDLQALCTHCVGFLMSSGRHRVYLYHHLTDASLKQTPTTVRGTTWTGWKIQTEKLPKPLRTVYLWNYYINIHFYIFLINI